MASNNFSVVSVKPGPGVDGHTKLKVEINGHNITLTLCEAGVLANELRRVLNGLVVATDPAADLSYALNRATRSL